MKDIMIFRRVEKKYRLTPAQKDALLERITGHLTPDAHGRNTICSLYLDTPDHLLIRNSIIARVYKEKLRLRSYGIPTADTEVFLEIKKKYKGVVFKRRIVLPYKEAKAYLYDGVPPSKDGQIFREIDYFLEFYRCEPKLFLSYEREALCGRGEEKALDIHGYLTERTVNIPQTLLESMNGVADESDNAVMFRFEF